MGWRADERLGCRHSRGVGCGDVTDLDGGVSAFAQRGLWDARLT